MTVHRFEPTQFHNTFGPHAAVLRIADGDSVETTTLDAHGYDARGQQVGEPQIRRRGRSTWRGPSLAMR